MASDALSEDDFEAGVFDDDDIDDDDEVEEEEEENTDFIEITDDENVGAGVSESPIYTKRQNVFLSSPRLPRQQGWYINGALRKPFPNLTLEFILSLGIALKIMGYLHDVRTESDKTTFLLI